MRAIVESRLLNESPNHHLQLAQVLAPALSAAGATAISQVLLGLLKGLLSEMAKTKAPATPSRKSPGTPNAPKAEGAWPDKLRGAVPAVPARRIQKKAGTARPCPVAVETDEQLHLFIELCWNTVSQIDVDVLLVPPACFQELLANVHVGPQAAEEMMSSEDLLREVAPPTKSSQTTGPRPARAGWQTGYKGWLSLAKLVA
eukprot:Skav214129  [mRNA]  locus=scaffold1185:636961:644667:- [translate_table: standard]